MYDDAVAVLARQYPAVEPPLREPGAISPNQSPLVAYYRGYARAKSGGNPASDYKAAQSLSTAYVFPSRRSSYRVLSDALKVDPNDQTARFLLGSLYLSSGLGPPAIEAWQRVRRDRSDIPVLHRDLGLALLQRSEYKEARAVLEEGLKADPRNVEVYAALDGVLSAVGASPRDRAAALGRYPTVDDPIPVSLVFKEAISLAEAGDRPAPNACFTIDSSRVKKVAPAFGRCMRRSG